MFKIIIKKMRRSLLIEKKKMVFNYLKNKIIKKDKKN